MIREILEKVGSKVYSIEFDDVDDIISKFKKLNKVELGKIQNMPDDQYWGEGNIIYSISKSVIGIIADLARSENIKFRLVIKK